MLPRYIIHRLVLLLFLLSPVAASAQFGSAPDFPGGPTDGCFSFVIGDVAYIGGGLGSSHMFSFNKVTLEWKDLGPLPGNIQRIWAYAFAYNGKGYIGGGGLGGAGNVTDEFFEYDPAANSWTPKAPFGGGDRDGCFAFVLGDKAYVGTGFDGQLVLADVWEYDFAADVWTSVGNYPGGARIFPSSFVLNGKGYVVGGAMGSVNESKQLYEFDPVTKGWTERALYPGAARQAGIAFVVGGVAYYGAGMAGYTETFQDFYSYNSEQNRWTKVEHQFPDVYTAWTVAFSFGDKAYGGLGAAFLNNSLDFSNKLYAYPPDAPAPRASITPGAIDFGRVEIGATQSMNFTIRSVTNAPLEISAIGLDDDAVAAGFTLGTIPSLPHTVSPLGSIEVTVTFAPQSAAAFTGRVLIETNDAVEPDASVMVTGEGADPLLPGTVLSIGELDFGEVRLGVSKSLDFTISPANTAGLQVQSVEFALPGQAASAGFSMTTTPALPTVLAPGEEVKVSVIFQPSAAGDASADITVTTNSAASETGVPIRGKGVAGDASSVREGETGAADLSLQLQRNPVNGILQFYCLGGDGAADLRIVDMTGRTVHTGSIRIEGEKSTALDVSQLPAGTYALEILVDGRSSTVLFTHVR